MYKNLIGFQESDKSRIAAPEVIDPDARVDKDQEADSFFRLAMELRGAARRRVAALARRSEPPIAASSLRASQAMSSRNPSRTRSLILSSPEAARAWATNSSDSSSVVLICINMYSIYV